MERKASKYSALIVNIPSDKIGKASAILRRKYIKEEWVHKLNKKIAVDQPKVTKAFAELYTLEKYYYEKTPNDFCVKVAPGII